MKSLFYVLITLSFISLYSVCDAQADKTKVKMKGTQVKAKESMGTTNIEFPSLKESAAVEWIAERSQKAGKFLETKAANALVRLKVTSAIPALTKFMHNSERDVRITAAFVLISRRTEGIFVGQAANP